jgi:type IV pilus assembly protein PilM
MDSRDIVLVRLKRGRGGRPALESHRTKPMPDGESNLTMTQPNPGSQNELAGKVRDLLETTGTKPGKISLVLPDNLAKISLVTLPERPSSKRQLDEIVRFKLRRGVPFRLEEAMVSYQLIPGEGRGVSILVALMRRSVVEQYERILVAAGARPGLVDLCTPNILNLCRPVISKHAMKGGDVALLNCAHAYFTLLIVRGDRLIFYRCKSLGGRTETAVNGALTRELSNSLAYYTEKLEGQGIGTVLVRSVAAPVENVMATVGELEVGEVRPVDPAQSLRVPEGFRLEPEVGQRIAPAVGAAAGRGR